MNIAILNYATGEVDFRHIPVDIADANGEVEDYLAGALNYNLDEIHYMCADKLTVNFINDEKE